MLHTVSCTLERAICAAGEHGHGPLATGANNSRHDPSHSTLVAWVESVQASRALGLKRTSRAFAEACSLHHYQKRSGNSGLGCLGSFVLIGYQMSQGVCATARMCSEECGRFARVGELTAVCGQRSYNVGTWCRRLHRVVPSIANAQNVPCQVCAPCRLNPWSDKSNVSRHRYWKRTRAKRTLNTASRTATLDAVHSSTSSRSHALCDC